MFEVTTRVRCIVVCGVFALLAASCGAASNPDSGAAFDAGRSDAGRLDGGAFDAGPSFDAGSFDAGSFDAGRPDAGESLPPFDAGLCAQLQSLVRAQVDAGKTVGIAFSVQWVDGARCSGAAGVSDLQTGATIAPDSPFKIGSVTKTFVAAVVLQLVDEHVLSLTDPVSKWLPTFPVGGVTIEQLLNHTSGLVDYLFDSSLQATQWQAHTDDQLYAIAVSAQSGATAPGTWAYSNTNALLLGRIIGVATGNPWYVEVRRRLLDRPDLGLSSTFVYGFEPTPGGLVKGYQQADGGWVEQTNLIHPTVVGSAGCMVSTMVDLGRWWRAVNRGLVFSSASLTAMRTHQVAVVPGQTWGLGVQIQDGAPLGILYGHGGGLGGYSTQMQFFDGPGHTVTVAENISLAEGDPLEEVDPATKLHKGIRPRLWQTVLGL